MIVDEKVVLKSLKTEFAIANFQRLHSAVEAAEKMMADWSDKEDDNIDMIILQQKQPSIGALIKRCSKNMQQIYWRTVIEIARPHGCSPCKFAAYFQNTLS